MANVYPIDVTITGPTQIIRIDLMLGKDANRIWANEKSIVIKLSASFVSVVMEAKLGVVTWKNKVIAIVVCN